jgi:DNA-binding CsgD family transcriptional regulator
VLSGNLGHYYWLKKNYVLSRKLTQIDYRTSLETGQSGSAMNALSLLIDLDIAEHKTADAQQKLADLEKMLEDLEYSTLNERVRYRSRTTVQEAVGNHKEALESYRKAVLYMDTISRLTDIENLRKTEFQINFEQKQAELQLLQEKKKRGDILIFGLVGITIALIVVFIVIIRLIAKRRRREKEIAALKQEQVEKELESTEKEMRTMLSNLIEKNALIEQLTEEIHQFQESPEQPVSDEKLKMLDKLQSFTLLTDDDWLEFKKLFEKLNPTFFNKVLSHSPDLTNAEIRLITLIKLNLSNLEMSRALGISPDSVRKTSLRLRKKLNMELHEELVKFILSL